MIDEPTQELVIQYLLGELGSSQALEIRARLEIEQELRRFADEIRETLASLALSSEALEAPANLPELILQKERPERKIIGHRFRPIAVFPWALAACLAIACLLLGSDRSEKRNQIAKLKSELRQTTKDLAAAIQKNKDAENELAAFQKKSQLSDMRIAMLKAKVAAYEQAVAVVVWDRAHDAGMIQVHNLPPAAAGKDYQLWIIDPDKKEPVSAGIISVPPEGLSHASFQPVEAVKSVGGFAISIEKSGGSDVPQGQIVLVGS
jgi:anti-sigma-K factor RskA